MRRILLVVIVTSAACGDDGGGATHDAGPGSDGATCEATTEELCGDGLDNDCDGEIDEDCVAGVGTFVSALTGDDANDGTAQHPVKTIGKGIANAMVLGGDRSVIVGEGTYAEKVTLVAGVDLVGGHHCAVGACDWARDIALYPSTIANVDFEGVRAGAGVTAATLVSGFVITGLAGAPTSTAGTVGVTLDGGSPTLRGNRITAGAASQAAEANNRSIGIAVRATSDAAGAVIENNEITAGQGAMSIGIAIESASPAITSRVTIGGNVVRSGSARRSVGILALRAAQGSTITNNDLTVGSSTGGQSVALAIASPVIADRNRIDLDRSITGTCTQTSQWCAAIVVDGTGATLTNNVALAPRGQRTAGLIIAATDTAPGTVTVANNYFDGGGSGPNGSGPRNVSTAILLAAGGNAPGQLTAGRIANNILVGGNNADRFGIREEPAQNHEIHPAFVAANLFHFAPGSNRDDTIYREVGDSGFPIDYSAVFLFEGDGSVPASGNDEADPAVDATFHLTDESPCIDLGTDVDAPAADFEGDVRPAGDGTDIGPDEH